MMLLSLLGWRDYVILGLTSALLILSLYTKSLYTSSIIADTTLTLQNEAIKHNEVNKTKIAELPKQKEANRVIYKDRVEYINTYQGDPNATACENAINKLRGFEFDGLLR